MSENKLKFKTGSLRQSYKKDKLDENLIERDPIFLFEKWFESAVEQDIFEPNAMTLATVDKEGKPSARIVLLKDFNENGFVFFTNYKSIKGEQLNHNPNAALVFWWGALERQIRIEGKVTKTTVEESKAYFQSRPLGSQLGAMVSEQSKPIKDYNELEIKYSKLEKENQNKAIECPPHWGGYRLKPVMIEFWQGRENRLHDRLRFTKTDKKDWNLERLSP